MTKKTLIDKCFRDKKGNIVLGQAPNLPLIVWVIASLLNFLLKSQSGNVLGVVSFGAIFTWAWMELFSGVNYFRKILGLTVLIFTIVSHIQH